jgi:hypothetical protein
MAKKPDLRIFRESLIDYSVRNAIKNGRVLVWISKSRVNKVPAWVVHYPDQPEDHGVFFLRFRDAKSCAFDCAVAAMEGG